MDLPFPVAYPFTGGLLLGSKRATRQRHYPPAMIFLAAAAASSPKVFGAPAVQVLSPAGPQASHIVDLWHLTLLVCAVVFSAVLAALLIALARARRTSKSTASNYPAKSDARSHRVIGIATVVSALVLVGLVAADILTERALSRLPVANALHIEMTGHQWWWETRYPADGDRAAFKGANELHVPVGRPVVLSLKSADVIHTFWVPSLHGKKDMIPGRGSTIEFQADRAGVYRGLCAEFCGAEHAMMAFDVVAEPQAQFEDWAARQARPAIEPVDAATLRGQALFTAHHCAQCHAVLGTPADGSLGPDLTHLASRPTLAAGTLPHTDEAMRRWILDPSAVKPGSQMPATPLTAADLDALVGYLRTLE